MASSRAPASADTSVILEPVSEYVARPQGATPVVDDVAAFKKIARAVVHEDEFTVELYAVILGSHSRDG